MAKPPPSLSGPRGASPRSYWNNGRSSEPPTFKLVLWRYGDCATMRSDFLQVLQEHKCHEVTMSPFENAQYDVSQSGPNYTLAAEQVVSELEQIPTYNNVLRQQLESIVAETEKAAFDIASQLQTIDQVVADLSVVVEKPSLDPDELVAAVRENNQRLADMFMTVLASVQFQDVTRQQIEHVVGALDRLDRHSIGLAKYLKNHEDANTEFQPLSEHLNQVFSEYVMESQRESHSQVLDNLDADSAPGASANKVELF